MIADRAVTTSKVDFAVTELYNPSHFAGGGCHNLIADLQSKGFSYLPNKAGKTITSSTMCLTDVVGSAGQSNQPAGVSD
jgi:hypothetical protein